MEKVKFGYFSDFADPTLLFFGSAEALYALMMALSSIIDKGYVNLTNDPYFQSLRNTDVILQLCDEDHESGIKFEDPDQPTLKWSLTKSDVENFVDKISAVIQSDRPCHHYLDSNSNPDGVTVVVSKGEYGPEKSGTQYN